MFWEIWGALVHGASCHMVEIRNALDPNIFSRFIIDHQISILFLTPALFAQFAVACFDALQTVRYICFGGDKLTQCGVLKKFADKGVTIANLYGPSECSGWCTKYEAVVSTQSTGAHLLLEEGQTTTKIIMFDAINISSVSPEVAELLKNEDVDLFHLGTAPEIQRFAKSQYKKAVGYMLSLKPRTYDGKVILLKALTTYQHAVVIEEQMKNLTEDNSNGWGKLLPNLEIILQSTSHSDMLNHDNLAVLEREISRLVD
eukprot:TRINITY_DN3075_c0_g2_i2.p1 TRINITY_DN3075_c0_g2~~TRINITY_DN3075_c0_g2_i2.p1  ORF type:complete len:258 (-),score=54.19 TRINITY_DN3075_c0_g2_i2:136-909(-)